MITRRILTIALLISSTAAFAQIEPVINDEWIPDSRMEQHEQFKAGDYAFPAKPRNKWNIGISLGLPFVTGDVAPELFGSADGPSYGVGLNIRKGLGYLTSLRIRGSYGNIYGTNNSAHASENNSVLNGQFANNPDRGDGVDYSNNVWIPNYNSTVIDGGVDLIFNLNNLNFQKAETRFLPYVYAGGGVLTYSTYYDATDANGDIYDWAGILQGLSDNNMNTADDRDQAVADALDGTYETLAETSTKSFEKSSDRTLRWAGSLGAGVIFRMGEKGNFELGFEHRTTLMGDDLIDGQRWESGGTQTPASDVYHFSQVTLGFNIGKNAQQPLWEVNPLGFIYNKLSEIDPANLLADADDDGVIDYLDREPNTPAGTPVDTHGVSLDSDKDGCVDSEDPEPFSTPNLPIENCQNVFLTENRVNEIIDERLKGIDLGAGSNWYLPMIFFDLDKSNIRPDAVASLANIADIMGQYDKLKVEVVGYADTRASESYNLKLSENRAKAAIEYLTSKGVAESRFVMKYEGEANNLIPDARRESEHQMNRRVEFHIVD